MDPLFLRQWPCPADQHMPCYWECRWGARNQLFCSQRVENCFICGGHPPPRLGAPSSSFLSKVSSCSSLCPITLCPEEDQPHTGLGPWLLFPPAHSLFSFLMFFLSHSHKGRCLSALPHPTLLPNGFLQLLATLVKLGLPCKCPRETFSCSSSILSPLDFNIVFFPPFSPQGHPAKWRHSCGCCHCWFDLHLGDEPSEFGPGWWGHIYHL